MDYMRMDDSSTANQLLDDGQEFLDYLPIMAERLGDDGLMEELAKGFCLLADQTTQTITLESLRRNGPLLGMEPMSDGELQDMLRLGDPYGTAIELDLHQFCIAVLRSSPALMDHALRSLFECSCEDDEPSSPSSAFESLS